MDFDLGIGPLKKVVDTVKYAQTGNHFSSYTPCDLRHNKGLQQFEVDGCDSGFGVNF